MNRPKIPVLIENGDVLSFTIAPAGDTSSLKQEGTTIYEPFFYDTISQNRFVSAKSGGQPILIKSLAVTTNGEKPQLVAYVMQKNENNNSNEIVPHTNPLAFTNFECPYGIK